MAGQIEGRTHSRSPLIWQLSSPRDYLVQLVPTRLTGFSTLGPLHQLVRLPPLNVATIKVQAAATFILKQGLLKCLNITHANLRQRQPQWRLWQRRQATLNHKWCLSRLCCCEWCSEDVIWASCVWFLQYGTATLLFLPLTRRRCYLINLPNEVVENFVDVDLLFSRCFQERARKYVRYEIEIKDKIGSIIIELSR